MYKRYIKRLLDIVVSLILIVILFPIMIIVAILLLVNLGFPLWNERREREGKNKKTFIMYKFRTKKLNSENLDYRNKQLLHILNQIAQALKHSYRPLLFLLNNIS